MITRAKIAIIFSLLIFVFISAVSGCTLQSIASQKMKAPTKIVLRANGPEIEVPLRGKEEAEPNQAKLKAITIHDKITMVITYNDSTPCKVGDIWEFDGSKWTRSTSDDTLVLLWNINGSIKGFNQRGFDVMTVGLSKEKDYADFEIIGKNPKNGRWEGYKQKGDFWMY